MKPTKTPRPQSPAPLALSVETLRVVVGGVLNAKEQECKR